MLNTVFLQITGTTGTVVADTLNKAATQATNLTQPPVDAVKVEDSLSLFDLIMKGGYIMIPIGVLLFFAIYVLIDRIIALSRASRHDKNFMNTIKDFIVNGNTVAAITLCKGNNSPQAAVVGKGLSRLGKPVSEIKDAMESAGREEVYKIEKNMIVLNIIGRIAPMFGFVGTIIGVVKIFYDISLAGGDIKIDTISAGLYQKMITSAGGLIVGIFAFASYHILNIVIEKLINRMETNASQFMDILNEPSK
jgi:biopolymer transport protein ExbB